MTTKKQFFGKTPDNQNAELWTITNNAGVEIALSNWGATIVHVHQPDRQGQLANIILGFNDASQYTLGTGYLGATCGRYANRIAAGCFTLNGKKHTLTCNNGPNHLHGGLNGFNSRLWNAEPYSEGDRNGILFTLFSPDGDQGYPGGLKVRANYALDESGRIFMEFHGESDAPTIINITNHAYWNLAGKFDAGIQDVELTLHASHYLPVDENCIPTGQLKPVQGTAFDFQTPKRIAQGMNEQPRGFDECMVIDGKAGELRIAAVAAHPQSGRKITLRTDRPGVQFYTGHLLPEKPFGPNAGFCLEPQDFPNAPNQPSFPSTVLQPGQVYHHRSVVELGSI